jgi:hypothetical protein
MSCYASQLARFRPSTDSLVRPALVAALALFPFVAHAQLGVGGAQILQQGAGGIPGSAATNEEMGRALAVGDFNNDGRDDLAIGSPGEHVGPTTDSGLVTVVYGATGGLDATTGVVFDLNGPAGQVAGSGDLLGSSLTVGDFDFDNFDDLAIGVPGYRVATGGGSLFEGAGAVLVLYGGAGGLSETGAQIWHQGGDGVVGAPEENDFFGAAVAAGDFNGDFFADLAVGVVGEAVGAVEDAGAVNVIFGSPTGLSTSLIAPDNQILVQEDLGSSSSETGDQFGRALAAGDFNADGKADLAIGTPFEDWVGTNAAGVVFVVLGSSNGLSLVGDLVYSQDEAGIEGGADTNDYFGWALVAGDFDGDGIADLAVGSPGEPVGAAATGNDPGVKGVAGFSAGAVDILRGVDGFGLSFTAIAHLDRADAGGVRAEGEMFGRALAAFDVGGDARAELVVGASGVTVDGFVGAGEAYVFFGVNEVAPTLVQNSSQSGAVPGIVEEDDGFGTTLATGDFDGNGFDDLAVGLPGEDVGAQVDGGAVNVLLSEQLFRDGFEGGSTDAWSATEPQ